MAITWNDQKNERNIRERGMPFDLVYDFDFANAIIREDRRQNYGERRMQAFGPIGSMIAFIVFVETETGFHLISLRKASRKERKLWHEKFDPK